MLIVMEIKFFKKKTDLYLIRGKRKTTPSIFCCVQGDLQSPNEGGNSGKDPLHISQVLHDY